MRDFISQKKYSKATKKDEHFCFSTDGKNIDFYVDDDRPSNSSLTSTICIAY